MEERPIETEWEIYREAVLDDAPPESRETLRRTFYAGVLSTLTLIEAATAMKHKEREKILKGIYRDIALLMEQGRAAETMQ